MSIFYNNLPLPIFLAITFIIPVAVLVYFYKHNHEYPFLFLVGMTFGSLSAVSTGIVRFSQEFRLFEEYSNWLGVLPIPFVILTIPLILAGAYQKVKHDEIKRKQIMFISLMQLICILTVIAIVVLKKLE